LVSPEPFTSGTPAAAAAACIKSISARVRLSQRTAALGETRVQGNQCGRKPGCLQNLCIRIRRTKPCTTDDLLLARRTEGNASAKFWSE
jgi:hypothetical protein